MSDVAEINVQTVVIRRASVRWWLLALRGLVAAGFGAAALLVPGITLVVLVLWLAIFMAADGVLAITLGVAAMLHHKHGAALVAEGTLGLVLAIIVLAWPGLGIEVLVLLAAAWAILTGVALLWACVALPELPGRILMFLVSVLSLALGALLIVRPEQAALALTMWLGIYALASGILMLWVAYYVRKARKVAAR